MTAGTELHAVAPGVGFVGVSEGEHFGEEGLAGCAGDGVGGGEVVAGDAEEG